jgi:hypothetical protein
MAAPRKEQAKRCASPETRLSAGKKQDQPESLRQAPAVPASWKKKYAVKSAAIF